MPAMSPSARAGERMNQAPEQTTRPGAGRKIGRRTDSRACRCTWDRDDGSGRAGAKTRRRQPGREAATVREPFQRVADGGAVDQAGANAADDGAGVEGRQAVGDGVRSPRQRRSTRRRPTRSSAGRSGRSGRRRTGSSQVSARTKMVKATWIAGRPQPWAACDRQDEQGPAILQVGDHHHADDAETELSPALARGRNGRHDISHGWRSRRCLGRRRSSLPARQLDDGWR